MKRADNPPPGSSKTVWRRWAKDARGTLAVPALSREVVKRLEAWPLYQHAENVLTYLAFGSELTLSSLGGKTFYATRTHDDGTLSVHALEGELEAHPYGFYEPSAAKPEVDVGRLELLLVPGLAFDRSGTRLGYGKGFYDRLLAQLQAGVPVVGVAPSALIVPELPNDAYDVRVTHLLSETGVHAVTP